MIEIQRFVTNVLESVGGIVEPIEYALADCIIPDKYKMLFQNRAVIRLAFDFEVAQENPDSEFVTFGSDVFNNILDIANTSAMFTIRYAVVNNLDCSNSENKILASLHGNLMSNARVNIQEKNTILVPIILFNFRAIHSSDIQAAEDIEVWVNLYNNTISNELKEQKNSIFFEKSRIYSYLMGNVFSIFGAFDLAFKHAQAEAEERAEAHNRKDELQGELTRIQSYYNELEAENEKRITRKGITEEKRLEIASKTEALRVECEKQLTEIKNKHMVKTSTNLMNAIIYYVPFTEYSYELSHRKTIDNFIAAFNPITKSFVAGCSKVDICS